jgi:hypothetical protein
MTIEITIPVDPNNILHNSARVQDDDCAVTHNERLPNFSMVNTAIQDAKKYSTVIMSQRPKTTETSMK